MDKKSWTILLVSALVIAGSWITFWQVEKNRGSEAAVNTFDESGLGEILPVQTEEPASPEVAVTTPSQNAEVGGVVVENYQPQDPAAPAVPAAPASGNGQVTTVQTPSGPAQISATSTTNPEYKDFTSTTAYFKSVVGSSWQVQESTSGQINKVALVDSNALVAYVEVAKTTATLETIKQELGLSNAKEVKNTTLAGLAALSYRAPGRSLTQYIVQKDGYQYFVESNNEVFLSNLQTL